MAIQSNFPSLKPTLLLDFANTKQLDPRITFTRGSTATYYDGVTTAMAEQNLLTYSQDFSNADWAKYKASITANTTTAPDGTATASTLTENNENFQHLVYRNNANNFITTGNIGTLSIYAKANTRSWINLNLYDGSNRLTWFDLTNGVVGTNAAGNTATITSVGSGWYRCIISRTIANGSVFSPEYGISSGDNVYTYLGNGTSSIYIWGAQLEQRSAVTAYTATTTQAITNYIPVLQTAASGVARFDNNPTTGESLGLLIEESRTNLMTYSSQFDNAAWGKTNSSVIANTVVAPDGTLTGDKLVENSTTGSHSIFQGQTISIGVSYTISVYAKAAERTQIQFQFYDGTTNKDPIFNLIDGTKVTDGGVGTAWTSTNVGNGWWRFSITATSAGAAGFIYMYPASGGTASYTGNGFSGVYIWGAQMELGAFATSYIPTVASQVTRAVDAASMTGTNFSSWYNQAEGTLYLDAVSQTNGGAIAGIGQDSFNSNVRFNVLNVARAAGTGWNPTLTLGTSSTGSNKFGIALKRGDYASSTNAGSVSTSTNNAIPPSPTVLSIGTGYTGDANLCGTIKKIAYYPIRLSNTNLQALTS
jgi:hypothetical protein